MGQPTIPPTPPSTNLTGKTVIVTGANSGMGLEAARQFLVLHVAKVILAVRSPSKGEEAAAWLRNHPSVKQANPDAELKVMQLDLDDYQSVLQFANQVKAELDALDVLLLNGGVNIMSWQTSKSGHERVMQVNYLSNALLALELLPLLEQTAAKRGSPSRLCIVGSQTQTMHSLNKKPLGPTETIVEHFDDKNKYASLNRYSDSKLLVSAFVQELAQRVPADRVIVNNMCPGLVATNFDAHLPFWLKPIMAVFRKLKARSAEEGARTLIFAAVVAPESSHGGFLVNNEPAE